MKVKLVFDDWKLKGKSIYNTEVGVELSQNDFHSGTTFDGEIHLDLEEEVELTIALMAGYTPSFMMKRTKNYSKNLWR
jgi:hypothetical protein